jgi:hypothetical protein
MGKGLYLWGVDGYGRAHIGLKSDRVALFSMINGSGYLGVLMLKEQNNKERPCQHQHQQNANAKKQ